MKPIILAGSLLVTLALIAYSIGVITEQRKKIITWRTLIFLSLGLSLDVSGTICMILGSSHTMFTYHGLIGYSALLAMSLDTFFMWRHKSQSGISSPIPKSIHKYSLIAYSWWVFVYLSGFLMAASK